MLICLNPVREEFTLWFTSLSLYRYVTVGVIWILQPSCWTSPPILLRLPEGGSAIFSIHRYATAWPNRVQPKSRALMLCHWMHGYSYFPTSPPYQRGYQSEVAKKIFSGKRHSFSEQKRCLCQSFHTRVFQQPGSTSGWTRNEIIPNANWWCKYEAELMLQHWAYWS